MFSTSYEWAQSCINDDVKLFMLRIQRSNKDGVMFSLSGRIEAEDVAELQRLLGLETAGEAIAFDLQNVTLVDRDAVKFLAGHEAAGLRLENCPAYIRQWIETERGGSTAEKG
jgi:hypothetical protein